MGNSELKELIFITMLVFMIMPVFLLIYAFVYNKRKKSHEQEKIQMKKQFDLEILTTQQEAREQTMQTIGADLHDNIGQLLSLTTLTLKSITNEPSPKIAASIELLSKAISEMRQLGKLLQGDQLLTQGLENAIQQEVDWLSRSGSYEISFNATSLPSKSNSDKDLFYFRILQEILNNIMKHAQADRINISLNYDDEILELKVVDNGIGFASEQIHHQGSGLTNIKKRASIVGGSLVINSQLHKGTSIVLQTPYP